MAEKRKDSHNRVLKDGEIERKDGRYEFRYKDIDGKRKSIYGKTLKELREKEKDIQKNLSNGMVTSNKKTLMQGVDEFLEFRNVSDQTKAGDQARKIRLNKYAIMNKPMSAIKEIDVKRLIGEMNQDYSRGTIMQDLRFLKSICAIALRNRETSFNPFDFPWVSLVSDKVKDHNILSDSQFDQLVLLCQDTKRDWLIPYLIVLRETGLRIGEFCGLTLDCVDLENKRLNINKQLIYINGHPKVSDPKTKTSKCEIPLSDQAAKALAEVITRCRQPFTIDGVEGFFIHNKSQTNVLNRTGLFNTLRSLQKAYNNLYPNDPIKLSPHVFRHTAATRLINLGMNPVLVQKLLRHTTIDMTLNTYTHASVDDVSAEMERLGIF